MDPNRRQVSRTPSGLLQGPSPPMALPPYQLHQHQYQPQMQPHHGSFPNVSLPQTQTYRPHEQLRLPISAGPPASSYASPTQYTPVHTPIQNLPPTSMYQTTQGYQPPHTLLPNTTTAGPYHQPIAPAPPRLPNLHPLASPNSIPDGRSGTWNPQTVQGGIPNPQDQPKHVVGSQGRRGILPSAPGRPAAVPNGANGSARSATIPAKNSDGKFPCPNCNKTYLHAKHLKRHMLRHTGDRPYTCVLCQDTFSRSDILKRHFAKCSIRRGNPAGLTHLAHPQAHTKKSSAGSAKQAGNEAASSVLETNGSNGLVNGTFDPDSGAIPSSFSQPGFIGGTQALYSTGASTNGSNLSSGHASYPPRPNPVSQWSSIPSLKQEAYTHPPSPITPNQFHTNLNSPSHRDIMFTTAQTQALLATTSQSPSQGSWPFQRGAQEGFMMPTPLTSVQDPINAIHNPLNVQQDGMTNDLFLSATSFSNAPLPFYLDATQPDPLQAKADELVEFCFPGDSLVDLDEKCKREMADYLSGDNVRHFLDQFSHFHGHWPILHMPTFNFSQANNGLILVIICIGAVYSNRMPPSQVQAFMHRTKLTIERTSSVANFMRLNPTAGMEIDPTMSPLPHETLEEIQALVLLQILTMWHGDPAQRATARGGYLKFKRIVRRFGLLTPDQGPRGSILHQLQNRHIPDATTFDWIAWVEQEQKSRLMFMLFLIDAAMAMYFNCAPQFQLSDIRLPLPADDAPWESRNQAECANALGLNGPASQSNENGTRRAKQWEMMTVVNRLMNSTREIPPNTTNAYSKFILIHALHVQIWLIQKSLATGNPIANPDPFNDHLAGFHTPKSQNTWFGDGGSGHSSRNSSGRGTPTDPQTPGGPHQMLKATNNALNKWKKNWDDDMRLQYPPDRNSARRFGFCRDGVHFYYLAIAILQANRAQDWQAAPDARFMQVMRMLKGVRSWAATDAAQKGEDLGSVGDIDPSYGLHQDLTLDMKDLFKPINLQFDSPVNGLQTGLPGF